MNVPDESEKSRTDVLLAAVERFWQARPPALFRRLYRTWPNPFVMPCEFYPLDAIANGAGREFGMLPQFLPFGQSVDTGGQYGFYVTPDTAQSEWPILYWDQDEMFLRPAASDFAAFLRHCLLVARYETGDQEEGEGAEEGGDEQHKLIERLDLPAALLTVPVPGNDTELHEQLAHTDPQNATSLCHLGCAAKARGDYERALDFFHRAAEAAPWFGDAAYLIADVYRDRDDFARACPLWWRVAGSLLPLCTRTWEWNLGEDHFEADIYEVVADGLAQYGAQLGDDVKSDPLWPVVTEEDPYDPDVRERLGERLLAKNDFMGAEREYLNALSLCLAERTRQPDRCYDALIGLYERTGRLRDAALARHDRKLPRPTV